MAYKSLFDGVIFIEGSEYCGRVLGNVEYEKDSFYNNQLKNLDNVKHNLRIKRNKWEQMLSQILNMGKKIQVGLEVFCLHLTIISIGMVAVSLLN